MSTDNEHEIVQKTYEMREKLRDRILKVIDEIDGGFRRSMLMYTTIFFFGIGIILFSIGSTVLYGQNTFTLVFGALGVLDIISFLVFKPTEDLQKSRGNLAQLISAFLAWYSDATAWQFLNKKILAQNTQNIIPLLQESSKIALLNTIMFMAAIEFFVVGKQKEEQVKQIQQVLKEIQATIQNKQSQP